MFQGEKGMKKIYIQSTLALRTPRYYGHLPIADSRSIPVSKEMYGLAHDIADSLYSQLPPYRHPGITDTSLLRTADQSPSQKKCMEPALAITDSLY